MLLPTNISCMLNKFFHLPLFYILAKNCPSLCFLTILNTFVDFDACLCGFATSFLHLFSPLPSWLTSLHFSVCKFHYGLYFFNMEPNLPTTLPPTVAVFHLPWAVITPSLITLLFHLILFSISSTSYLTCHLFFFSDNHTIFSFTHFWMLYHLSGTSRYPLFSSHWQLSNDVLSMVPRIKPYNPFFPTAIFAVLLFLLGCGPLGALLALL